LNFGALDVTNAFGVARQGFGFRPHALLSWDPNMDTGNRVTVGIWAAGVAAIFLA